MKLLQNKWFEVVVIVTVLILFLFVMKSVYGLAGSLNELHTHVNTDTGYRFELLSYINQSNMTLPKYTDFTTEQLEQIAKEVMTGGNPYIITSDAINAEFAPSFDTFSELLNSD